MSPMNARTWSSTPSGRSITTPPMRMYAWFIRRPVIISNTSRISSRSRNPYSIIEMAPSSSPVVASHTRWLAIRFSSVTMMRIVCARGGASMPIRRSAARQYESSLKNGAR